MTFNTSGLLTRTQETIDGLTSANTNEHLIMSAYDLPETDTVCYVETSTNLPDLAINTDIPDGFIVYIKDEDRFVVSSGVTWVNLDGTSAGVTYPYAIWTWGAGPELGGGVSINSRLSPGTIAGNSTDWTYVSNSPDGAVGHVLALKNNGSLWSWGNNFYGQLGDGTVTERLSPVSVSGGGTNWLAISAGGYHSIALKTDGSMWSWGMNGSGQLGIGTTTSKSSPVSVLGGNSWVKLSAGDYHNAAIKTDGTLWTWGYNDRGQLGDGVGNTYYSPITTAGGGTNWNQVSAGKSFTAAIKTDGTLWTWGWNTYGGLGDNTDTNRYSPVTTAGGGTTWSQVSAGTYHMTAIKTDGTLWTWGFNLYGQLGDGTKTSRRSPVTTAGGGTDWYSVSSGADFVAAIKTDGTLWTWGDGNTGKLANGGQTSRLSPATIIGGGNTWIQVSAGFYNAAAIKLQL